MMANVITPIKCIIVGEVGTGKTAFCKRVVLGAFEKQHQRTVGVSILSTTFNTNRGLVSFNIWDTAGQEGSSDLPNFFFKDSQCAIIMYDLASLSTFKNVPMWQRSIKRMCPKIPIIICGNKSDLSKRMLPRAIVYAQKTGIEYLEVSAKTNYNVFATFLSLARSCACDSNLYVIAMPAPLPPEVSFTKEQRGEIMRVLVKAQQQDLPLDADDQL